MEVSERVKLLLNKAGMSQRDFAKLLGISAPRLNNYLSGKHNIPQVLLIKMSELTNAELSWLLTGKEPMYNSTHARENTNGHPPMIQVPIVADIAAGSGIEAYDTEPHQIITIDASLLSLPGPYWAFRVDGDSMEPTLTTDDIAIITRSWHEIDYNGMICAFRNDNGLLIKRVYVAPNAKFGLLIPVNPRHQILKYDRNSPDLILLGILVASIRLHNNQ